MIMLIQILVAIKIIHQLLYNLYLWQLKEYRKDRFTEHIKRTQHAIIRAYLHLSILAPFSLRKLPRPTIKVILILFISIIINTLFIIRPDTITLLIGLMVTPITIIIALGIIFPIEWSIRYLAYKLAQRKIKRLKAKGLTVIGITGSYGKTSTKYFLTHTLSSRYKVHTTQRSINTPLAVSLTILKALADEHAFFIVEMGAYRRGEILELCKIAQPDIGIVTGIGSQHLALFGSQENIIKGKSELLRFLPSGALTLINKESTHQPLIPKNKKLNVVYYSKKDLQDWLKTVRIPDFLKVNTVPGLIIAERFNIPKKEILIVLNGLDEPEKTMKSSIGYKKATIIDDSFTTNENGFFEALKYLENLDFKKRFIIMPCLIELGERAQEVHIHIGKELRKSNVSTIVTTRDYFDSIKEGSNDSQNIHLITKPESIIKMLKQNLDKNTIVLIEGKVNQQIIDFLKK